MNKTKAIALSYEGSLAFLQGFLELDSFLLFQSTRIQETTGDKKRTAFSEAVKAYIRAQNGAFFDKCGSDLRNLSALNIYGIYTGTNWDKFSTKYQTDLGIFDGSKFLFSSTEAEFPFEGVLERHFHISQVLHNQIQKSIEDELALGEPIDLLSLLMSDQIKCIFYDFEAKKEYPELKLRQNYALFAGSFNPLHDGHKEIRDLVAKSKGVKQNHVVFELACVNADKGRISSEEIKRRVKQFDEEKCNVIISNCPFFSQKREFVENGWFVLGGDTLKRLLDSKYYGGSHEQMIISLNELLSGGNQIIIAPRFDGSQRVLLNLDAFAIPSLFTDKISELKGFRNDVSSTLLRSSSLNKA